MQLSEEMSSAKAQYTALHKEIGKRVLTGEEIEEMTKDRDQVFNFYNLLLREHQFIIEFLKENHLKAQTKIPMGFLSRE